jgi:hypothetical protein
MALQVNGFCRKCEKSFTTLIGSGQATPNICPKCEHIETDKKTDEYFATLDSLTLSQRVRKLEEWIYNYKPYREVRF